MINPSWATPTAHGPRPTPCACPAGMSLWGVSRILVPDCMVSHHSPTARMDALSIFMRVGAVPGPRDGHSWPPSFASENPVETRNLAHL